MHLRPRWLALGQYPIEPLSAERTPYSREDMIAAITALADRLSTAEQQSVLEILERNI